VKDDLGSELQTLELDLSSFLDSDSIPFLGLSLWGPFVWFPSWQAWSEFKSEFKSEEGAYNGTSSGFLTRVPLSITTTSHTSSAPNSQSVPDDVTITALQQQVDKVIRWKVEHEKAEQELQAWEIQEVREHPEKEHAVKEKAAKDHEEQEAALQEVKAWKEHTQWEQGGMDVRALKKMKKKVWAWEEVDSDDEVVVCSNCEKWRVEC
jgi:hypothetical protein